MKTQIKKNLSITSVSLVILMMISWMATENGFYPAKDNDFIKELKNKLSVFTKQMPEDRIYLHFDKTLYEPGETIWFSAYARNGENMKASSQSEIIHVELIGPKGNTERKISLIARNGKAAGDFVLGEEALGGLYKIKAYTNWMKNDGDKNAFEKDIQVQDVVLPALKMKLDFERKAFGAGDEVMAKVELQTNENKPLAGHEVKFTGSLSGERITEKASSTDAEGISYIRFKLPAKLTSNDGLLNVMILYQGNTESVSRSIPIILNKINFSLFPEGGDLVCGLESNVAFRALNEFNKPADVEGIVVTEKGSRVASFNSFHQGMGAFKFIPQPDEKYYAQITRPEGISEKFELPEAYKRGYVLKTDNSRRNEMTVSINTTEKEELSLVAQVRGKIYYSTAIKAVEGENIITFPTGHFPIGVAQVTLFDSRQIARAERLAFVNKHKKLDVSISTDKEKYLPREKVKLTLCVKDERGLPMPAHLSVAVVNDQLLSFADDKSGNILSQLLLEQDLKDKVEEPAFYFNEKEHRADKALDYLMMTSGWRRFTWEKIMNDELPAISWQPEKTIISGTVIDASTGKPVPKVNIKVNNGAVCIADEQGKFILNNVDLYQPALLTCDASGYRAQSQYAYAYNNTTTLYLYSINYGNNNGNGMRKQRALALGAEPALAAMPAMAMEENIKMDEMPENKMAHKPKAAKPAEDGAAKKERNLLEKEVATEAAGGRAFDKRANAFMHEVMEVDGKMRKPYSIFYYRARQFSAPVYDKQESPEVRTDFRNTIYWNPDVEIDRTGKKMLEFYASDDITSFRATTEGFGTDGSIGRTEKTIYTQLPFSMSTKVPVEVVTDDLVSIPLTLKNNTTGPLGGELSVASPEGLSLIGATPGVQTIMPGKAKTIYLDYRVLAKTGTGEFTIKFKACGLSDAFTQKIKIVSKGFPVNTSFSGQDMEKEFTVTISNVVNGSIKATFTAYPNVVSDLMKGIEGILREPYGCFEQTSMSSYPNAMVLDYLKTTDSKDEKLMASATSLLDKGYQRLVTFETKEKGYEWFGSNPGHEALTAYGLMQFNDMKNAGGKVDDKMIVRTAEWLMAKRDGKGGFTRSAQALDNFGRASKEITNAYIVYALSEAGFGDIKKEFEASWNNAAKSKDPYMLALAANTAFNLKENGKGEKAMEMLYNMQDEKGAWNGKSHSITYSTGQSLIIETTSLGIMGILKSSNKNSGSLTKAVQYLVGSRGGHGAFGNTQGTILALKALTQYARFSKRTKENGTILVYVDGKKVAEKNHKAGDNQAITMEGLEDYLKEGKHTVKVKYTGAKDPLPYSIAIGWNTFLPASSKECAVEMKTKLAAKTANVGETVRLTTTVKNTKSEGIPSTMVIIGIPAGLTAQPWQLKELQEKKVFDYYEIIGNNIAIYYRCMGPNDLKTINLDLKAEVPGEFDAPASSGYLYYTNEYKSWSAADRITIKKNTM